MRKKLPVLFSLLACAGLFGHALPEQIVSERFADRNRSSQNPPESLEWFASAAGVTNVRGTYLHMVARRDGTREVAAHFPATALKAGETLILEFDFHFGVEPANNPCAFSFGLFDASQPAASPFTEDGSLGGSNARGITVLLNPHDSKALASFSLAAHKADQNNLLPQSAEKSARIGKPVQLGEPLHSNRSYHADLRLQRDRSGKLQISFELSGGGIPSAKVYHFTAPSANIKGFDTVAFGIIRPGVSDIYLTNISIVHEPSLPAAP